MPKLKIITGENHPILRAVAKPVKKFDGALKKFARDLKAAMIAAKGLGIAAPQVGESIRLFWVILNFDTDHEINVAMVNPDIISHGAKMLLAEEGCLSLPGVYGNVKRYKDIIVEFFDLDGGRQRLELSGLNARVVQHEKDHLDGVLFIDLMSKSEKQKDLLF